MVHRESIQQNNQRAPGEAYARRLADWPNRVRCHFGLPNLLQHMDHHFGMIYCSFYYKALDSRLLKVNTLFINIFLTFTGLLQYH